MATSISCACIQDNVKSIQKNTKMKNQLKLKSQVLVHVKTTLFVLATMFTFSMAAELSARYLSSAGRKGDVFDTKNFKVERTVDAVAIVS